MQWHHRLAVEIFARRKPFSYILVFHMNKVETAAVSIVGFDCRHYASAVANRRKHANARNLFDETCVHQLLPRYLDCLDRRWRRREALWP